MRISPIIVAFLCIPTVFAQQVIPLQLDVIESACDARVTLTTATLEINAGEPIKFSNNVTVKRPFVIEYWAEWANGTIAKKPLNTTNAQLKSFTPKRVEGDQELVLKNRLLLIECEDTTADDNTAEARVLVHGTASLAPSPPARLDVVQNGSDRPKETNATAKRPVPLNPSISPTGATVYESSTIVGKRLAVWLLVGVACALAAVLVWRR